MARESNNLARTEKKYPKNTNGIFLPVLSDIQPPKSLNKLAKPSLNPLNAPTATPPPPKELINKGNNGVIISLPTSLNILAVPNFIISFFDFFIILI